MTMKSTRTWWVVTMVVLVLASGAGCTSGSGIAADSSCGAYLRVDTQERHAAATRISTELRAHSPGNAMWGTSLDTECGTAPDMTLRAYFAGQLALDVPSVAMERTVNASEKVLVNTLAYTNGAPRHGEVVVFTAPQSWRSGPREERFIKRVIGIGGDHVVCCDRQQRLVLNGHPLDEPYLYKDDSGRSDPPGDAFDITVPVDRLWVLGDHRSHSGDSLTMYVRSHDIMQATIAEDALVGRAFVVFDPRDPDRFRSLAVPSTGP
jgi:signal peptidase I